ncbi:MAG TPA: nuclear transport factor 2 family protein [Burkholderiales bacterium]
MAELSPRDVVDAFFAAIAARDFENARRWLADDGFSSYSPIASFDDADAYIADISRVGPILEGLRRRHTVADGEEVCAVVEYVTHFDRRAISPVAHWMRVRKGRIAAIESYFDARAYASLFVAE